MDKQESNKIIKKIKERRAELGLSYQDLAKKTGLSKSTLQRYETGYIKNLAIDKVEILAKALEISPGYLMGWEENIEKSVATEFKQKKIKTAKEAIEFILKQPILATYGGYNIRDMTDEDLVEFANELLRHIELLSLKYNKD